MKIIFTEEHIRKELNKIYIEEDDLLLEGEFLEGSGREYVITGVATIEGERYHAFEIAFALKETPTEESVEAIMEADWDWYDYLC